jgi:hypothetical protein
MALSLNVPSTPYTSYTIFLDGRSFKITFRWSSRTSKWYYDLVTSQGIPVTLGTAVHQGIPLINKTSVFSPEGQLYLVGNSSSDVLPSRTNIGVGREFELLYLTKVELENL